MRTVLRFFGNLLLAALVIVLAVAILSLAYGLIMSQVWETAALDEGVAGGTWADVGGQPIYYRLVGPEEGTAVVLVHGLGMEGLEIWDEMPMALAKSGLRVVAVDLVGFGQSARDASTYTIPDQGTMLATLLAQLQVEEATVVAHGWGANVALQLASDKPDMVSRLVLMAPRLEQAPPIRPQLARVPYLGRSAAWVIAAGGPVWRVERRLGFLDASLLTRDLLSRMARPTHVRGTIDAVLAMSISPVSPVSPRIIAETQMPVLVLVGEQDRFVPVANIKGLTSQFPNAEMMVIPDAGYYLHIDQAVAVDRIITGFALQGSP